MKLLRVLIIALLLFGAFICRAEFAAYRNGNDVLVTNEECDLEQITEITLGKGEIIFVDVRGTETINFRTSDAFIVRVDGNGALIAARKGSCRIRVFYTEYDCVEIKCKVKDAPSSVKFAPDEMSIVIEESAVPSWRLSDGAAGSVELFSSDESIAVVESDGTVRAAGIGECDIIAETYNGVQGSCHVYVTYPAPAIIKGPGELQCYEGETVSCGYTIEGGYMETLSYTSSDAAVAEVDNDGLIRGIKPGSATITVEATGGARKQIALNVLVGAAYIRPEMQSVVLYTGGTAFMNAECGGSGNYSLVCADNEMLIIDGHTIQALLPGRTEITFITPNGKTAVSEVIVMSFPLELGLRVTETELIVGETSRVTYTDKTGVYMPVTIETSNPGICHLGRSGVISALSEGEAVITFSCGGVTQTQTVVVKRLADSISFENSEITMAEGDSIEAVLRYENGWGRPKYTVSDEGIIACADGVLTALASGTAELKAELSNGAFCVLTVNVLEAPDILFSSHTALELCECDRVYVDCRAQNGTYAVLTRVSGDESVLETDGEFVRAAGAGKTELIISAQNGVSITIPVTVAAAHERLALNTESVNGSGSFTDYLCLRCGEEFRLEVECCKTFNFEAFDADTADVTADGLITAHKPGTAKIKVTSACGAEAVVLVEVTK